MNTKELNWKMNQRTKLHHELVDRFLHLKPVGGNLDQWAYLALLESEGMRKGEHRPDDWKYLADPLTENTYRYKTKHVWLAITANDCFEALLKVLKFEGGKPSLNNLERWNGTEYVPVCEVPK